MALALVVLAAGPPVAQGAPRVVPNTVLALIHASSVTWRGAIPGASLEVALRRADALVGEGTAYADRGGMAVIGLRAPGSGSPPRIIPGDRLELRVDGALVREVDVPLLYAIVDREAGSVRGMAPPGAIVTTTRHIDQLWFRTELLGSAIAAEDGQFALAYPPELREVEGIAQVTTATGDVFRAAYATDVIDVDLGDGALSGRSSFGTGVDVVARTPDGTTARLGAAVPQTPQSFAWQAEMVPRVALRPGTLLTATHRTDVEGPVVSVARVPQLAVEADLATGELVGIGPPEASITMMVSPWEGDVVTRTVAVEADGTFRVADLPFDSRRGFAVQIAYDSGSAIRFVAHAVRQAVAVGIGATNVRGFHGDVGVDVTVTVLDASGGQKAWGVVTTRADGSFSLGLGDGLVPQPFSIASGDTVLVDWSDGDPVRLVVPDLQVQVDVAEDRLTGTAPAGSHLSATLVANGSTVVRDGSADASSTFDLSFADVLDLKRPVSGSLIAFVEGGFLVTIGVAATDLLVETNRAFIRGVGPTGQRVNATLERTPGVTTARGAAIIQPVTLGAGLVGVWELPLFDLVGDAVHFEGGDILRVTVGTDEIELTIPRLQAEVDVAEESVVVLSEPGLVVNLTVLRIDGAGLASRVQTARLVMDAQGRASKAMDSGFDIAYNDDVRLIVNHPDGHELFRGVAVPGMTLDVDGGKLDGFAPAGSTIEVFQLDGMERQRIGLARSVAGGRFSIALEPVAGSPGLAPGDRVSAMWVRASDTVESGLLADFTVPDFTLDLDAERELISGRAPYPGRVFVAVKPMYARQGFEGPGSDGSVDLPVSGDGHYEIALADIEPRVPVDTRPGQRARAMIDLPDGTRVVRSATLPIVNLQQGGSTVCGYGAPQTAVRAQVLSGPGVGAEGAANADRNGAFQFRLAHPSGERVALGPASQVDVVVGSKSLQATLPRLSAVANWTYQAVDKSVVLTRLAGWVEPNTQVYVRAPDERCLTIYEGNVNQVNAERSGDFAFSNLPRFARGQALTIAHYLAGSRQRQYRLLVRPLVRAVLGTRRIEGRITPGERVTISWTKPDGTRLGTLTMHGDSDGRLASEFALDSGSQALLAPGDVFEARLGNDTETIVLGGIDFDVDRRAGIVASLAPGTTVRLELAVPRAGRTFVVRGSADAEGRFVLRPEDVPPDSDWSLADVTAVHAIATLADGHEVARHWERAGVGDGRRVYLPFGQRTR